MNNVIKRVWNQNKMVAIEDLKGMTFQAESGGHTFQISGVDDAGNVIALSGSVAGVFLRPDNTDVAITGSASGGVISVTLPANCYDVPGRFGLTIFVTANGQKTAVYAAVGTVSRTSSGTVSPGTTADVVDLINQINAAVATIPASWTGLMADIAPTYSDAAVYPVGAYVYYNGDLYRCTTAITTAESWTAGHWTAAVLGNDVSDLKSALTEDENILLNIRELDVTNEITPTMTSGMCSTDGTITASTNYEYTQILPVKAGDVIHCKATPLSGQPEYAAPSDPCFIRFVTAYSNDVAVSDKGVSGGTTQSYTVSDGIDGVRLTLNLQLYTSGSLIIYHESTEIEKSVKYEGLVSEVYGSNLIDKSLATNGAVQSDGSISVAGSFVTYKTSAYIPVKATKTYTLYVADAIGLDSINATRLIYLLYDSNRQALTYANQAPVANLTIAPNADGYVRVCANDAEAYPMFTNKLMLIEGTEYVPYEPYSVEKVLNDEISPINDKFLCNVLKGKKWCPCGDSFTEYTNAKFTDGKYTGRDKTYPYLIALRNNMEIDARFFKSGRTLAYPADGTFTNSLTCPTNSGYYQNIPEDVDYVTIMLGINDCQHTGSGSTGDGEDATGVITLGTIDDTTTATYYGAYNTVLGWLRQNRPFAHVGVIVTNGTQLQDYTEAQINVAKKWGYPYINLNGDERTPAFIRCYNPNLSTELKESLKVIQGVNAPSNTHPNWQTHELESTIIEAWMRTL